MTTHTTDLEIGLPAAESGSDALAPIAPQDKTWGWFATTPTV